MTPPQAEDTGGRAVPAWALAALSKRVGTVERIERAKVLEERAFRKSAIVYAQEAAYFVTTGLLGPRVVRLDAATLAALATDAVEVACPACEAEMRVANLALPGSLTCVGCGTALEVAEDRSVATRKGRPRAGTARSSPADQGRVVAKDGVRHLKADFTAIRGIGRKFQTALYRRGIRTYPDFLAAAPEHIAKVAGISREQAARYQAGADLRRVNGVGEAYAELLRAVGCWTLWNLAASKAKPLSERVNLLRETHELARNSVSKEQVQDWITQAKALVA